VFFGPNFISCFSRGDSRGVGTHKPLRLYIFNIAIRNIVVCCCKERVRWEWGLDATLACTFLAFSLYWMPLGLYFPPTRATHTFIRRASHQIALKNTKTSEPQNMGYCGWSLGTGLDRMVGVGCSGPRLSQTLWVLLS
jgi:hypothetical protein